MPVKRAKFKGKKISGSFLALPHTVLHHMAFTKLTARATKLLLDIAIQYNGINNGDLCITLSVMKKCGWNSNDQLTKARDELLEKDLIILTRQGGRHTSSLYAITWQSIDECKGKLDIKSTRLAPRSFK